LRNKLSRLILITLDCSFQMVPISFFFNKVWEEREARPVLKCWALSKEASCTIFIMSLVWHCRGSNPRPPAHGANALTTEPPLRLNFFTDSSSGVMAFTCLYFKCYLNANNIQGLDLIVCPSNYLCTYFAFISFSHGHVRRNILTWLQCCGHEVMKSVMTFTARLTNWANWPVKRSPTTGTFWLSI